MNRLSQRGRASDYSVRPRLPAIFPGDIDDIDMHALSKRRKGGVEYTYIFEHALVTRVKIGRSRGRIHDRFTNLLNHTADPENLRVRWWILTDQYIPGLGSVERWLHGTFDRYRLHGEWFAVSSEDVIDHANSYLPVDCVHFRSTSTVTVEFAV